MQWFQLFEKSSKFCSTLIKFGYFLEVYRSLLAINSYWIPRYVAVPRYVAMNELVTNLVYLGTNLVVFIIMTN